MIIIQITLPIILWMAILFGVYWILEVKGIPSFLDFKPFNCRICCTFWSELITALGIFTMTNFKWYIFLIMSITLNILTTIALKVDERKRSIDLTEINKIIEEKKRTRPDGE